MPAPSLTLTTELQAVNTLLGTISEAPISTLETAGLPDAAAARSVLHEVSRNVQTIGWGWNTDENLELSPATPTPNRISVGTDCLKVDTTEQFRHYDVIQRGSYLYDREEHSDSTFTEAIEVDIVRFLAFELMPEAARAYITIRAARIFQNRKLGSETLNGFTAVDEARAWATLVDAEAENEDLNVLDGNAASRRVLRRS